MKKFVSVALVVGLVSVLSMVGASPASSTPSSDSDSERLESGLKVLEMVLAADNPDEAMNSLSTEDRRLFDGVVVPVETKAQTSTRQLDLQATEKLRSELGPNGDVSAAACWSAHQTFEERATFGDVIYTWWQGLSWCASNGSVTSYSVFDRGGETSTAGWSYIGNGGSGSWNVGWETRQYTQENFRFATQWVGFTRTKCAQIRGGATGLYSTQASCSLG